MLSSVYLISAYSGDQIIWKIGVSKHPKKRFREHKTANPNLIKINALFECESSEIAFMIESKIKKLLEEFKIDGEWFDSISLTPDLFIAYCERYYDISVAYFNILHNLKN